MEYVQLLAFMLGLFVAGLFSGVVGPEAIEAVVNQDYSWWLLGLLPMGLYALFNAFLMFSFSSGTLGGAHGSVYFLFWLMLTTGGVSGFLGSIVFRPFA